MTTSTGDPLPRSRPAPITATASGGPAMVRPRPLCTLDVEVAPGERLVVTSYKPIPADRIREILQRATDLREVCCGPEQITHVQFGPWRNLVRVG